MIEFEKLIVKITTLLIFPFTISLLNIILKMILKIMRKGHLIEIKERKINAAEEQKQEIDIDKDLEKYLNYKEL